MRLNAEQLEPASYYGKVFCERMWKWNTVGRAFDDYDLWYVWSGSGELRLNGEGRQVGAGSCFLFRPGDETVGTHNARDPITVTFIHFRGPENALAALPSFLPIRDRIVFETYLHRYVHALMENRRSSRTEAKHLLYLLLLAMESEQDAGADSDTRHNQELLSVIHEVAAYVRQFPAMIHNVTVLAQRANLSERYFSRKFKAIMGRSVENYVIGMKIERAEHLLRNGGMNVSEVASALGYGSVYYFSRQFRRYRGFAPSELLRR